jgi:hypothetical protein
MHAARRRVHAVLNPKSHEKKEPRMNTDETRIKSQATPALLDRRLRNLSLLVQSVLLS